MKKIIFSLLVAILLVATGCDDNKYDIHHWARTTEVHKDTLMGHEYLMIRPYNTYEGIVTIVHNPDCPFDHK